MCWQYTMIWLSKNRLPSNAFTAVTPVKAVNVPLSTRMLQIPQLRSCDDVGTPE
jgi:hypothetical protein